MDKMDKTLSRALQSHRAGDLKGAEILCHKVLKRFPEHPDALHLLGMVLIQTGRNDEAVAALRRAVRKNGHSGNSYGNLAVALQNLGRNEEAADVCRSAIRINPDNFNAFNTLGNALRDIGNFDEAAEKFRIALLLKPNVAEVHLNLAHTLKQQGKFDEALRSFSDAAALKPDAGVYFQIGMLLNLKKKTDECVANLLKAIEVNPRFFDAYFLLGKILAKQGKFDAAEACYRNAVRLDPGHAETKYYLGKALASQERFNEAVAVYAEAIAQKPDFAAAHSGIGSAYREMGLTEQAMTCYRQAVMLSPGFAEVHCNISNILLDQGEVDRAIESCRHALALKPDLPEAHWNIALAMLTNGNLQQGWQKYGWRFLKKGASRPPFTFAEWDGSSLRGKRLLVYAEQGVGDEIMFASCLPDVMRQAEICAVECDKRLLPLFSRSFPDAVFFERSSPPVYPESKGIDFQAAIGDLPRYVRPDLSCFPQRKLYLVQDPAKTEIWRDRFAALGEGLKVGISWRGGRDPLARHTRSTGLGQWSDLFSLDGLHFINLQYGDCSGELRELKEKCGVTIHEWEDADPLKDLENFAAEIASLDLVISVDNSTVHMAGALGIPVWTLLPFAADWRWMRERDDTPWYPAMRLYRQNSPGDWEGVFKRVHEALRGAVSGSHLSAESPFLSATESCTSNGGFRQKSQRCVALLNDTSYWYHWGCMGTSTAIRQTISDMGFYINPVPITGIYNCIKGPLNAGDFDRPELFAAFADANSWIIREIKNADVVVINGEGSLHGLCSYTLNLLYLAYVSGQFLGKNVRIINHSCYPDGSVEMNDTPAWDVYRKVYSSVDFAAVREPVSFELMKNAGMPVVQSFDCLPLYIKRNYRRPVETSAGPIVIAGSVAWKYAGVNAISSYIQHMNSLGHEVRVLTGAKALPSPDDCDFVKILHQNCPDGWEHIEVKSMETWLDAIAGSSLLVSGRFHHTIAASVLGPFILLESNTPKNEGIARVFKSYPPISYKDRDLLPLIIGRSEKDLREGCADQKDTCCALADILCELAENNFIGLENL